MLPKHPDMDTFYKAIRNATSVIPWGKLAPEPEQTNDDNWVIVASFHGDSLNDKEREFVESSEVAILREAEARAERSVGEASIAAISAIAMAKIDAINAKIKLSREVADACAAEATKLEIEFHELREAIERELVLNEQTDAVEQEIREAIEQELVLSDAVAA